MSEVFDKFVNQMKTELEANSHKGDWTQFKNKNEIINELYYHIDKLEAVRLSSGGKELMREYCADIANIALFMFNSLENE